MPATRKSSTASKSSSSKSSSSKSSSSSSKGGASSRSSSSGSSRSSSSSGSKDDAIALLKQDHKEVKALFKEYEKLAEDEADGEERQALAEQICAMLTVHATIEEEIFYPAARGELEEQDLLDEAEVEHACAKDLIAQIQSMQPDDELYDAKVKVLGEYVDHHVQEEENEMFPKAKKTGLDLKEIGAQLAERKMALETEMGLTEQDQEQEEDA